MICDRCHKRKAAIYIKTIINGHIQMMGLCEKCGAEIDSDFTDGEGIYGLFGEINDMTVCPECGRTLAEVIKTGYLGCEHCYSRFKENIRPMIRRLHGVDEHKGKLPKRVSKKVRAVYEIRKLIEEKERALMGGDIVKAKAADSKIIALKKSMEEGGNINE